MPSQGVIDTVVLRKANAALTKSPREGRAFAKRLVLLRRIQENELRALMSAALLREYRQQILEPRNEFVASLRSHSASVGSRADRCSQYATASSQLTITTGASSLRKLSVSAFPSINGFLQERMGKTSAERPDYAPVAAGLPPTMKLGDRQG